SIHVAGVHHRGWCGRACPDGQSRSDLPGRESQDLHGCRGGGGRTVAEFSIEVDTPGVDAAGIKGSELVVAAGGPGAGIWEIRDSGGRPGTPGGRRLPELAEEI